jgi:hypothetical protein
VSTENNVTSFNRGLRYLLGMRELKLNETYTLHDESLSLVSIVPIRFEYDYVVCKFLYSYSENERKVSYELFEKNGLIKPENV